MVPALVTVSPPAAPLELKEPRSLCALASTPVWPEMLLPAVTVRVEAFFAPISTPIELAAVMEVLSVTLTALPLEMVTRPSLGAGGDVVIGLVRVMLTAPAPVITGPVPASAAAGAIVRTAEARSSARRERRTRDSTAAAENSD